MTSASVIHMAEQLLVIDDEDGREGTEIQYCGRSELLVPDPHGARNQRDQLRQFERLADDAEGAEGGPSKDLQSQTSQDSYNADMKKGSTLLVSALAIMCALAFSAAVYGQYAGWTVPPTAKEEKSPLKPSAETVKRGRGIFTAQCQKCHGPQGKGDGPDSNPQAPAADLTDEFRYELNPEGVIFHKISGGHPPEMPAFKDQLKSDEIWQVVAYVLSLRKPQ